MGSEVSVCVYTCACVGGVGVHVYMLAHERTTLKTRALTEKKCDILFYLFSSLFKIYLKL